MGVIKTRGDNIAIVTRRLMAIGALALLLLPLAAQTTPTTQPSANQPAATQPAADSEPADPDNDVTPRIYVITMDGMVNDVMRKRLERQLAEAAENGATQIVLEMDTWGGIATSSLEISDVIKNETLPITAWVHPKAISAGAMISLACDQIVMAERARIGDCMPIAGDGSTIDSASREKIETIIREEFRDSARRNGYSIVLCTAMVTRGPAIYEIHHVENGEKRYVFSGDLTLYGLNEKSTPAEQEPKDQSEADNQNAEDETEQAERTPPQQPGLDRFFGPGVVPQPADPEPDIDWSASTVDTQTPYDSGKWKIHRRVLGEKQLLTMSQDEAIEMGFSKQIVRNKRELATFLGAEDARVITLKSNWSEDLVAFLTHPVTRGILTILFLMGLYSEFQSPGLGLPGAVALTAGILLIGAPYMTGLANAMDILIILAGILLITLEIFVIPGFGIAGISGAALVFIGLIMTFVPEEPGPGFIPSLPGTWDSIETGFLTILISFMIALVGIGILTRMLGSIPVFNRLILTAEQAAAPESTTASAGVGGTGAQAVDLSVGQLGVASGDLKPGGRAEFESRLYEVTTRGGWIENGAQVRVAEISGSRVVVEEA